MTYETVRIGWPVKGPDPESASAAEPPSGPGPAQALTPAHGWGALGVTAVVCLVVAIDEQDPAPLLVPFLIVVVMLLSEASADDQNPQ